MENILISLENVKILTNELIMLQSYLIVVCRCSQPVQDVQGWQAEGSRHQRERLRDQV